MIPEVSGWSRPTVIGWRDRYASKVRPGWRTARALVGRGPLTISATIAAALRPPPPGVETGGDAKGPLGVGPWAVITFPTRQVAAMTHSAASGRRSARRSDKSRASARSEPQSLHWVRRGTVKWLPTRGRGSVARCCWASRSLEKRPRRGTACHHRRALSVEPELERRPLPAEPLGTAVAGGMPRPLTGMGTARRARE